MANNCFGQTGFPVSQEDRNPAGLEARGFGGPKVLLSIWCTNDVGDEKLLKQQEHQVQNLNVILLNKRDQLKDAAIITLQEMIFEFRAWRKGYLAGGESGKVWEKLHRWVLREEFGETVWREETVANQTVCRNLNGKRSYRIWYKDTLSNNLYV